MKIRIGASKYVTIGDVNPLEGTKLFVPRSGENTYDVLWVQPYDPDEDEYVCAWLSFDPDDITDGWITPYIDDISRTEGYNLLSESPVYQGSACIDYFGIDDFLPTFVGTKYTVGADFPVATADEVQEVIRGI